MKVVVFLLFTTVINCTSKSDRNEYLNAELELWKSYVSEQGIDTDFQNTLFLFTYPTYCGDCLYELNEWNNRADKLNADLIFIVIDRFEENAQNFATNNNFRFKVYADTLGKGLKNGLIPSIPQKVYFLDREVKVINRIGDKKSYEEISALID